MTAARIADDSSGQRASRQGITRRLQGPNNGILMVRERALDVVQDKQPASFLIEFARPKGLASEAWQSRAFRSVWIASAPPLDPRSVPRACDDGCDYSSAAAIDTPSL
jgi:hypothetical protein